MDGRTHDLTQLLRAWGHGDHAALEQLTPLVYDDLRRMAHRYMAQQRPEHTLQTTALVHEAYIRLMDWAHPCWQNRAHFFAVCARTMRHILVDCARARQMVKRGAGDSPLPVVEGQVQIHRSTDLVALDDALRDLATRDPRKSQVVELRFFGGLTAKETAKVLKVSEDTVLRDWKLARVWLWRQLSKKKLDKEERYAA